jgi:uncharacterized protein YgbK (DUF1537 family)
MPVEPRHDERSRAQDCRLFPMLGQPPSQKAPKIGVLADDLSGALATASCLRARGWRTTVRCEPDTPLARDGRAVAVNMRTRDFAANGYEVAAQWAAWLTSSGCRHVELRIDSTLRGEPELELRGVLAGVGHPDPLMLAIPAFPEAGRFTVVGRQISSPRGRLDVPVGPLVFGDQPFRLVPLPEVERGATWLSRRLQHEIRDGGRRFVFDATDAGHLLTAAGVATQLLHAGPLITLSPGSWLRHPPRWRTAGMVVVAISSPTEQNAVQLDRLATLEGTVVVAPCHARRFALAELARSSTIVVETIRDGASAGNHADRAAAATEDVLRKLADGNVPLKGVVASGGHTAACLLDRLGPTALDADLEVDPLCPRGHLVGGPWSGLSLITKGGLVGDPSTLTRLVMSLHQEQQCLSPSSR